MKMADVCFGALLALMAVAIFIAVYNGHLSLPPDAYYGGPLLNRWEEPMTPR